MRRALMRLAVFVLVAQFCLQWAAVVTAMPGQRSTHLSSVQANGQSQDVDVKPAQIVILVDESGSISQEDIAREQNAASLLAQSELSVRSSVSIVGFASDNGSRPPVDVVCPPIVLTGAAERDRIVQCVRDLRKRTRPEGDGTDHAEALKQALSHLGQGDAADGPKLVFLLTDGVLDVSDSPRYGVNKTGQQRNDAAREVIRQSLGVARDNGVQIWPLGFGKVDKGALEEFAAGGFQGSCGAGVPTPSATVVSGSADVTGALLKSFGAGRCVGIGPLNDSKVGPGGDVEVPLMIPAIATDGSIIVVKNDSRINVTYVDPQGRPVDKAGESASGKFQVSGETGPVEVLRIVNPAPGDWKVRITSPPGVPPQNILTAVTWQGAAQALIRVDPPSPAVGQQVTVSVQIVLRGGKPIVRPELLQGLTFAATMSGENLPERLISLQDNGQGPDSGVDGTYTGQTTVPGDAQQRVSFRGQVTGLGISAADAVAVTEVAPQLPSVLVTTTLPTIASKVAPGETLLAKGSVSNNSGARQRIRVTVRGDGDATITVPVQDAVREVDPGSSTFDFRMAFGATSPQRVTTGLVQIVDDADPTRILHQKPFTVDVGYPPPGPPWLLLILGSLLGIALITLVLYLVARRRAQELKGLMVQAGHGGPPVQLRTEARKAKRFRFIVDMSGRAPRLDIAVGSDPAAFVLSRSHKGLRLRIPTGEIRTMHLDETVELDGGLTIMVSPDPQYADQQGPDDTGQGLDQAEDWAGSRPATRPPAAGDIYL